MAGPCGHMTGVSTEGTPQWFLHLDHIIHLETLIITLWFSQLTQLVMVKVEQGLVPLQGEYSARQNVTCFDPYLQDSWTALVQFCLL